MAIHCTLAHAGAWSGVAAVLSGRLTTTAYDLPSHGGSEAWTPDRDQHRMATDMGLALLKEPMDLIGHSFGATVAMRMAIEQPELVRSLTMIEPVFFAAAMADFPEHPSLNLQEVADLNAMIANGNYEEAARTFNRGWGDGTPWMEISERARRYMVERIGFVLGSHAFLYEDVFEVLNGRKLETLKMPVLLLQGEMSPPSVDLVHAAIARRIPQAKRVTVKGAGHMLPITHPKQVAQEIAAFLDVV